MLTLAQFKAYASYPFTFTAEQDQYVNEVLLQVSDQIEREIGTLFNLVQVDESNPDPFYRKRDLRGTNMDIRSIGAWQPSNLNISIGCLGYPTFSNLVIGSDCELIPFGGLFLPGKQIPVIAIHFNRIVRDSEIIRITGTYGFSNGWPADLEMMLYNIIKTKFNLNNHTSKFGSEGQILELRSQSLTVRKELSEGGKDYATNMANSIMNVPEIKKTLNTYKNMLRQQIAVS